MAYNPEYPKIDETGLHSNSYTEVREYLIERFKMIFGEDIYLGEDTQDYQMISTLADSIDDVNALLSSVYTSHDPDFAVGAGLDLILAINGIGRKSASYSMAVVTLTGESGTVINSGAVVKDEKGNKWILIGNVTIPSSGSIDANFRCEVPGAVYASANSITNIYTPTAGWTYATNANPCVVGSAEETDSEVRKRREDSLMNGSTAMITSLYGNLASVEGVDKLKIYENSTSSTADSIPAHSFNVVVRGGDDYEIADVIFKKKAIGVGTYGSTSKTVVDVYGQNNTILFDRPTNVPISVSVQITPQSTWTDDLEDEIKNNIAEYINALGIGEALNVPMLWYGILKCNKDINNPSFTTGTLTATKGGTSSQSQITCGKRQVLTCDISSITVVRGN